MSFFSKKFESFGANTQKLWPKNKSETKVWHLALSVSCNHPQKYLLYIPWVIWSQNTKVMAKKQISMQGVTQNRTGLSCNHLAVKFLSRFIIAYQYLFPCFALPYCLLFYLQVCQTSINAVIGRPPLHSLTLIEIFELNAPNWIFFYNGHFGSLQWQLNRTFNYFLSVTLVIFSYLIEWLAWTIQAKHWKLLRT